VKKYLAILFLLIFLTANTAFGQLLRLPILVHHYLEHVEYENASLIKFLSEHYATIINHPDDKHHDHKKLPFKTLNFQVIQAVTLQATIAISQIIPEIVNIKNSFYNPQCYSNTFLNSIWQPPRLS
jgi:hypothetical protein